MGRAETLRVELRQWAGRLLARLDGPGGDRLVFTTAYLVLLPLYLAPLLVTKLLPGLDLPFHLSLADMLAKAGRPDSPYAPYYAVGQYLAPYSAHYLALVALSHVVPIFTAHKLLIALYVAALPLGTAALLAARGRSRVPALLAFPLAYNIGLHYGFVGFALSLAALVFFLAALARFLASPSRASWIACALLGAVLFLCHLQNFLYGAAAAIALLVFTRAPGRRRLLGLAALAPAAALVLAWRVVAGPAQTSLAAAWHALAWARLADLDFGKRSIPRDVLDRLAALSGSTLCGFADGVDVRATGALLAVVALYFCAGLVVRKRSTRDVAVWVVFAGALFAYLALPHHLPSFAIMTFFPRFAPLVLLMMLPLVPPALAGVSGRLRLLLPVPAVLLAALYGGALVHRYRLYAAETADFLAVMDHAEPGHRALGLPFDRESRVLRVASAFAGLPAFYPLLQPAPASMTSLPYCGLRHIPCRVTAPLPDPGVWAPRSLDLPRALAVFDYFFVRAPPPELSDSFSRHLELVAHQGTWWLYRRRAQ